MSPLKQKESDTSARQKIIAAARVLFTRNGYTGVKTRDIAKEAGINLALLNYYFGSKEKLFEMVMMENIGHFFKGVALIVNDEKTSFYKKVELLVDFYIMGLMDNPDVPLFVLTQARNNPKTIPIPVNLLNSSYFIKQYEAESKKGKIKRINAGHLMMNILGLAIFPFVACPMIKRIRNINDSEFKKLMLERRKLIPQWIQAMLEIKK